MTVLLVHVASKPHHRLVVLLVLPSPFIEVAKETCLFGFLELELEEEQLAAGLFRHDSTSERLREKSFADR